MKHNGERRPDEIQAEIQRTRSHMDATLTALEQRLTPGQLVDQGIDYLKHSGAKEFVSNLGDQARTNPMPVALMGIGLAWLMATGRSYQEKAAAWRAAEGGPGIGEKLSGARERLGEAREGARERITQARRSLSDTAQSMRERLSGTAESTRHTYEMLREQPLALGAIGLAIGAVLAAALPRTRKEDELMGSARDRLAEQAKEKGKEQLEKAKEVVGQAAESMRPEQKPQTAQSRQGVVQPAVPGQSIGASAAGQPPRRGSGG
jgi:ElaB/YqjD/DUF883 family membrane-anchored ribosome-binding protein